jgi:hypothetical protein
MVLAGAAGVVLAVAIGAAIRPADARPPIAAVDSPSPEGQVAGGNPSASPRPTADARVLVTFDELVMGESLPSEWRVLGDPRQVQVAPFPTAVDRSLRLSSGADGASTALCRLVHKDATRILVDVYAAQPDGLAVTLRDPGSAREVGITVASLGTVVIRPSGEPTVGSGFEASQWQRVTLFYDAAAGMRAAIGTPGPTNPSVNGSSPLPGWQPGGRAAEVCVASPPTSDAELFIDNLVIE